jgi:DNA replication protein DnaC
MAEEQSNSLIEDAARVAERNAARRKQESSQVRPVTPRTGPAREPDPIDYDRRRRISTLLEASMIPRRYRRADLEDLSAVPGDAFKKFRQAVDALKKLEEQPGVVAMLGGFGAGKTWMACALVRRFCLAARYGRYVDAMDYFIELRATFGQRSGPTESTVEASYMKPELLVLDALEERADSAWNDRMLTRLIDKRYKAELSTILISNEQEAAFRQRIGPVIADRIFDAGGGLIECTWPSLRGRIGTQ